MIWYISYAGQIIIGYLLYNNTLLHSVDAGWSEWTSTAGSCSGTEVCGIGHKVNARRDCTGKYIFYLYTWPFYLVFKLFYSIRSLINLVIVVYDISLSCCWT